MKNLDIETLCVGVTAIAAFVALGLALYILGAVAQVFA